VQENNVPEGVKATLIVTTSSIDPETEKIKQ
jgi:hypothetical protein